MEPTTYMKKPKYVQAMQLNTDEDRKRACKWFADEGYPLIDPYSDDKSALYDRSGVPRPGHFVNPLGYLVVRTHFGDVVFGDSYWVICDGDGVFSGAPDEWFRALYMSPDDFKPYTDKTK